MKFIHWASSVILLSLVGCGSPVPSGMYLTMSVSTYDVAVATALNGEPNTFLSSDNGSMTGSMPLNKFIHAGENEIAFELTPVDTGDDGLEPSLLATLEITLKGEYVDTQAPGERTIFSRELTNEEADMLIAGETVTIIQSFTVDKTNLETIKTNAN